MTAAFSRPVIDWNTDAVPGVVWIAVSPVGEVFHATTDNTPWGCRSELIRLEQFIWPVLEAKGFVIQRYALAVAPVLHLREQVTSNEGRWRYPANGEPAPGGDSLLLTVGRVTVLGTWTDDDRFIAWAPKIQRDKPLEERLGL